MKVRHPIVWVSWMVGIPIIIVVSFGIPEYLAMSDEEGLTLSQFSYTLFSHNPLLLAVISFNSGGLIYGYLVHIFWHWMPKEMKERCRTCGRVMLKGE